MLQNLFISSHEIPLETLPYQLFELAVEMGESIEAATIGNLRDGVPTVAEHPACSLQPKTNEILKDGFASFLLELPAECRGVHPEIGREGWQTDVALIMNLDISFTFLYDNSETFRHFAQMIDGGASLQFSAKAVEQTEQQA